MLLRLLASAALIGLSLHPSSASESGVVIVARMTAKPGQEAPLSERLRDASVHCPEEPGCSGFDVYRDNANPRRFVLVERWRSQADLERHWGHPWVKAFFDSRIELLEADIDATFVTRVAP